MTPPVTAGAVRAAGGVVVAALVYGFAAGCAAGVVAVAAARAIGRGGAPPS